MPENRLSLRSQWLGADHPRAVGFGSGVPPPPWASRSCVRSCPAAPGPGAGWGPLAAGLLIGAGVDHRLEFRRSSVHVRPSSGGGGPWPSSRRRAPAGLPMQRRPRVPLGPGIGIRTQSVLCTSASAPDHFSSCLPRVAAPAPSAVGFQIVLCALRKAWGEGAGGGGRHPHRWRTRAPNGGRWRALGRSREFAGRRRPAGSFAAPGSFQRRLQAPAEPPPTPQRTGSWRWGRGECNKYCTCNTRGLRSRLRFLSIYLFKYKYFRKYCNLVTPVTPKHALIWIQKRDVDCRVQQMDNTFLFFTTHRRGPFQGLQGLQGYRLT